MPLRRWLPLGLFVLFTLLLLVLLARSVTPRMPGMPITGGPPINRPGPEQDKPAPGNSMPGMDMGQPPGGQP